MQHIKQTETTMVYLLEDERPSYDFEDLREIKRCKTEKNTLGQNAYMQNI